MDLDAAAWLARPAWRPQELLCPAGTLVAGVCPGPVPGDVGELLHPSERRFAAGRSGDPLRQWVAGRYCLAIALRAHALNVPVLPGPNGKPLLPAGFAASISHKGPVSVAIATTVFDGIGVDLEHVEESDRQLAEKVLTKAERDRLEHVRDVPAWFVTVHFALKEAVYKAAPDDEQEDLEFEDIELAFTSGALIEERIWESVLVTVSRSAFEYRGYMFRDGPWVLAVATRFPS